MKRKWRPRMPASSTTSGATPGAAWSLRSSFTALRAPGTWPYSAKHTASSTLVLPAPVGPLMRNRPASPSARKSIASVPENGPNAVTFSWSSLIGTFPSPRDAGPGCGRVPPGGSA